MSAEYLYLKEGIGQKAKGFLTIFIYTDFHCRRLFPLIYSLFLFFANYFFLKLKDIIKLLIKTKFLNQELFLEI